MNCQIPPSVAVLVLTVLNVKRNVKLKALTVQKEGIGSTTTEKLSNKEIENVEQGQNCEYTCKICRNNKEKTSMLATEFPKRNISSNIDILGEGELRNDEVQDANGTNICHVCTAIIKTTFEICDLCNNSIHVDCCELANTLTTCYVCIGHSHINNQKDQSSNELENTVEQENTSAAIQNKDNKNQSNNNIPEQKSLNLKNGSKIWN